MSTADQPERSSIKPRSSSPSDLDLSNVAGPSRSSPAKTKPRVRINMACIHCRNRKIKCDGHQPSCATCVRLKRGCDYEPVSEFENLLTRERKRRNKEKKTARLTCLSVFPRHSPLSLYQSNDYLLPTATITPFSQSTSQDMSSLYSPSIADSQFGPRRKRGISMVAMSNRSESLAEYSYPSSISQPSTPEFTCRVYDELSTTNPSDTFLDQHTTSSASLATLFAINTTDTSLTQDIEHPANASKMDYDYSTVQTTLAVPNSAHVRPIDLPAPHGHFDFASFPYPTTENFANPVSMLNLRRGSVQLPFGAASTLCRPSLAKEAKKRTENKEEEHFTLSSCSFQQASAQNASILESFTLMDDIVPVEKCLSFSDFQVTTSIDLPLPYNANNLVSQGDVYGSETLSVSSHASSSSSSSCEDVAIFTGEQSVYVSPQYCLNPVSPSTTTTTPPPILVNHHQHVRTNSNDLNVLNYTQLDNCFEDFGILSSPVLNHQHDHTSMISSLQQQVSSLSIKDTSCFLDFPHNSNNSTSASLSFF